MIEEEKNDEKYMENFPAGSATDTEKCHRYDRDHRYHRCSLPVRLVQYRCMLGPYENTGNLKVAVASVDEGYEGSIIPIKLTLGDQVLSALRENTQLEWVFTTKSKAMKGVKSGKYYAAIVIPEDFSRNMMSVFTSDIQKPEITYYSNAKENAIAPKVTDKGATAIQTQVNEVFIETISDTVFTALQTVSNAADREGSSEIVGNLITNLEKIHTDLTTASSTLQSFSGMTSSAQQLLDTTASFLRQTQKQTKSNVDALKETQKSFSGCTDRFRDHGQYQYGTDCQQRVL